MTTPAQPTQHERDLMNTYPETTPIGWITGELQRHAHIGTPGHPGPIETLCGATITRTEQPSIGADFETCTECWSASVWIRNRRAPAISQHAQQTRPTMRYLQQGVDWETATPTQ